MEYKEKFFKVDVSKYCSDKSFSVFCPSSLDKPKNNSVMFVTEAFMKYSSNLLEVMNCVVIWPKSIDVPKQIEDRHVIILSEDPRLGFAMFFYENNITNRPKVAEYKCINGAFISTDAIIGENTTIFPGAYIGSDVIIGDNCYIGSGVKIVSRARIGSNVIIRENSVIGSDGMTTKRDKNGKVITIPQFGGVIIEDDVQIGALTVIARGAIDDTIISSGCRIDNSCFISHNVRLGEDNIVVGETIMFGSSTTGRATQLSGNSTVRDGVHIGSDVLVGMGSVVISDIESCRIVKGNPAR